MGCYRGDRGGSFANYPFSTSIFVHRCTAGVRKWSVCSMSTCILQSATRSVPIRQPFKCFAAKQKPAGSACNTRNMAVKTISTIMQIKLSYNYRCYPWRKFQRRIEEEAFCRQSGERGTKISLVPIIKLTSLPVGRDGIPRNAIRNVSLYTLENLDKLARRDLCFLGIVFKNGFHLYLLRKYIHWHVD